MSIAVYRGLKGKARRNRKRNLAAKFHQDEWIAECLKPNVGNVHRDRIIPIRGRSEFLPAIAAMTDLEPDGVGQQLELSIDKTGPDHRLLERKIVWPPDQAGRVRTSKLERRTRSKPERAIRFGQRTGHENREARDSRRTLQVSGSRKPILVPPMGWPSATTVRRPVPAFTLGGFAYGCLLGGAAAALLLMFLDTFIR